jgi:hypothetical protein
MGREGAYRARAAEEARGDAGRHLAVSSGGVQAVVGMSGSQGIAVEKSSDDKRLRGRHIVVGCSDDGLSGGRGLTGKKSSEVERLRGRHFSISSSGGGRAVGRAGDRRGEVRRRGATRCSSP